MLAIRPWSSLVLAVYGFMLMAMGLYFIFLRPALLQVDLLYMKITLPDILKNDLGLQSWLKKVFWVMGSYIFTTGLLTFYIARTSFRTREKSAFVIVVISGFSSIAFMAAVNFIIGSDFKWLLLVFTLPWALALIFYRLNK